MTGAKAGAAGGPVGMGAGAMLGAGLGMMGAGANSLSLPATRLEAERAA